MSNDERLHASYNDGDADDDDDAGVRFNGHVSYVCTLIALIIGIIVAATAVVGDLDYNFAILGLALAVALLALAGLQQHRDDRNRPHK